MKKLLSSFVILLAAFAAVAQNSFSYQSVIRADGKVLENKSISLRLSIMLGDSICYQEQHAVTTNAYGNVNVSVGEGEPLKGSFAAVPWESMRVMMRIEADVTGGADFTDLGSMQIMPVPYAMYAHRTTTVIQPAEASEEPIFEINDSNGNPMFAVYETGVKVFVDYDDDSKAAKSKFAVAGRPGKGDDIDLLTIDKDGTLVYVDDDDNKNTNTNTNANKAAKSKFAVAGRPGRKGDQQNNLLTIDGSGSTIYIDDNNNENTNTNANKAAKSKFAVAGRPGRKSATDTYFTIDQNGTLVYVDDNNDDNYNDNQSGKAAKSRFAVAGRPGRKGGQQNNMLTIDGSGSTIYIDDNNNKNDNYNDNQGGKAAKSRFAVAGRPGRKGADSKSENLFTIDGDGSTIYVDFNLSDKAAKSRFAVAGRPGRKDASDNVMTIDGDQATFYIDVDDNDNQNGKAAKSRFAVAGRPGKGDAEPYFIIDQFGSVIYIDEADSKAAKSRFAVAGRSGKGGDNYFTINRDSTRIYINDAPVADTTTGEVVVPSLASGFAVVGMVQKSDLLAVSKDSTIIKIDTYVAEEVQSVSGEVSKIIDDSKADKSYSSGALYLPLVKKDGGVTSTKKFLINYTYYHSDNGEYLYLKTQFKSGSDLINTFRNYYIVDGQVYGDNTYHVKYIEAGAPTIMPYSEVNSDFKEKLKLDLKSDNDLLVILESTMRDSAYSALAEDGRTAFYSPNGDHGKVMESERNIVAMMNDSARSLFTGNLNVFYSLLDTAVRATQKTLGLDNLTTIQWNYGTVSDFYNIDLSDYYYTLYDGDITDGNIKITENSEDFAMRGDYQRRNLFEIETMFAGLKEGFDINAQPNNAAWGSVEKPASKVNYGDSINLVPVAAEGCIFLGWNDGCADSVRRIGITGPINYTAKFQPTTYYVSNKNSSDDFDGFSAQTPLDSLSKAIEKINAIGKADASFTINVSGLFVNDTTVTIGACAAKSLTIAGVDKQTDGFKIKEAATNTNVITIANSTTKVTLKNLKITGGSQYGGNASALFVGGEDINANVLLDNVLITDNSVDIEWGAPSGVGVYVGTGSMLTIGSGTEIKANKVGRNGRAVYNYGTIVMTGGTISDNINHDSGRSGYATDIDNCGEFTIDGDAVIGNVYVDTYSNKTITIGNNFNAKADIVGMFMYLYDYYSPETQLLTLPDGLSDAQKKAICDKFAVEPETDWNDNPISYWKVGTSGKLEQVGHVVFITEKESVDYWGIISYEDTVILEYNLDFNSNITIKPDAPDSDHLYLWYKSVNGQPDVNEFDFTKTITSDEPIIGLLGRVVPTKCYVSFDTKVEDVELDPQEVAYGGKLSEQWMQTLQNLESNPSFKKDGYTFAGWCVEEDLWDSSHKRIIDQRLVPFDSEQPVTANVTLIANWVANELYVDVTNGSNNYSGIASNKAFKTIQKAIDTIKYWNVTNKDYTIKVSGSSDECVWIGHAEQYPYAIAKTITLQGVGANSGLTNSDDNYYTMLTVGPNNEVVLNNFKFNPVGEIYNYKGKAIYVCVNAKVTLSEGTVLDGTNTGEYQSNSSCYGGGVYVDGGTLVMESNAVIKNFKVKNGGGVYVSYNETRSYDYNGYTSEYKQGSFTMKGNAVIQNCNGGKGAGVFVVGYPGYQSTFTMEDNAKIEGCTGVGVEVGSDATFNMYGSTRIETCSDRGVEVSSDGTFNMFGNSAIGGSEGKGCTGGLSIYGGEAIMNENASISYNTGVANGAGVRVGGGGSFMMTGGTIAYNIAKAEGQYSSGAWGCGVYVETNVKNATEAWTSVFEMRGGSIYGNTATEATPAIYGRGVFVASSYYENNSSHPFFESTFMLKGGNIAADNDVALQMKKMSDDTYMSAKITLAGTLADDVLVTITPYYTQNNQHQSGLQVLATADGAQMQNDKFVVTDQVVGTTTTYWKVDSEGKLALRSVVTFMSNGSEFAKMPVGNNGKVAEPATKPTSTDKVFTGWYTDAEGTIPFNFDNEVGSTTTTLYAGWGDPEVYVPSAPDGAAGAMTAASLAKAVELINSKDASDLDWTIKIYGQLTGKQVIGGEIAADSITLIGARDLDANGVPRDMLNGNFTEPTDSAVLNIFATNPVIIKNLKITGGNNTTDIWTDPEICGGGLHVASGAKVSLTDGVVIAGNKAYAGGGAYVKGIMYMYGSAVIGDANAKKAPEGESDCSNYASRYGGGVYVAGGRFYMGYEKAETPKELTGGIFGNISSQDGGGVYVAGTSYVYANSGIIANNGAQDGGAVYHNVGHLHLGGSVYIPAGADFKHDVFVSNSHYLVHAYSVFDNSNVAQITPSISYSNYSPNALIFDNIPSESINETCQKFTVTPLVKNQTITYYQFTYSAQNGLQPTSISDASDLPIPQFTQITLSDNVFGGDNVTATITGANFTETMLNFTSICLNDTMVNATFTLNSANEITATFPAPATAGTRTVKVQTYGAEPRTGTLVVNGADPHTFYVKPGGDDTNNDGLTPNTAFASLQKAVESMSEEAEYTIKVIGALPDNQKLGKMQGEIGVTGSDYFKPVPVAASSIVLTGNGDSDELSGGGSDAAALTINTDKPVTITNLTITGGALGGLMIGEGDVQAKVTIAEGVKITGNNGANTSGGGVKVGGNSTLTMTGGEISGNSSESATEDFGGGVIVNGTFNMEGGTIKNNTAENGSGVYVYDRANFSIKGNATIENNDVYLVTGATIAIAGALEGTGTVATITPQSYPSATDQVQVLSGDYVADAYDRFAVTNSEWTIDSDGYLKKEGQISYIDENGVVQTVEAGNYTVLLGGEYRTDGSSESNYVIGGECQLAAGTYVVNQNIYTGHLILQGDVKIILCNGATLNIWMYGGDYAIQGENYSLDVYAQTGSTGTLNAHPTFDDGGIKVKNFGFYGGTLHVDGNRNYEIPVIEAKTVTFGYQTVADRIKLFGAKGIPDTTEVKIVSGKMMTDGEHVYSGTLTAEQHTQINNIIEQEHKMVSLRPTTSNSVVPEWKVNDGNGHSFVDLGVSVKWATANVGADSDKEAGDYVAWGETEPYYYRMWEFKEGKSEGYAWSSYQFTSDGGATFSKYNSTSASLESADDAATHIWGTNWRTPTVSEFEELFNSCYWVWTDDYYEDAYDEGCGTSGFIVYKSYDITLDKQMTKGSDHIYSTAIDAHIFLEIPYRYQGTSLQSDAQYWTSELDGEDVSKARSVGMDESSGIILDSNPRYYGMQIRAVCENGGGTNQTVPTGALNGKFSVSDGKQVYFSQGNLQYQASTQTWRFAEEQYDYIGTDNQNIGMQTYTGWIDLFGWGTGDNPTKNSTNNSEYDTFTDWGNNKISNGGNEANLWRTLTIAEWNCLLNTRTTTSGQRYAKAKVYNVNGLVLLPDNWNAATYVFTKTNTSDAAFEEVTDDNWSTIEAAGAVFLPAAGYRDGSSVSNVCDGGYYSSATVDGSDIARNVGFYLGYVEASGNFDRYRGWSVRLVQDVDGGGSTGQIYDWMIPDNNGHYYVEIGGTKWATFNVGATVPEQYGDLYAWGETETHYELISSSDTVWREGKSEGYTWSTYEHGNGASATSMNKYTDAGDVLLADDDAASMNWGGEWRMPTYNDWMELKTKCYWVWVDSYDNKGVSGYIAYEAKEGDGGQIVFKGGTPSSSYSLADKHIFFPAGGEINGKTNSNASVYGTYWTSSLHTNEEYIYQSYRFSFNDASIVFPETNSMPRYLGYAVRPVYGNGGGNGGGQTGFIYYYDEVNQTATITRYEGSETDLVIPSTTSYNGKEYTVTAVGESAFAENYDLESVTFAEGSQVVTIGNNAFYQCYSLTSITIPATVTTIGESAFSDDDELRNVNIPDGVTQIGSSAFYNCSNLSALLIPNSVAVIGSQAFYYNLTLFCAAQRKPDGWADDWQSDCIVSWGFSEIPLYGYADKDDVNKTLTITSYNGTETEVTIPATLKIGDDDYAVTAIGDNAFAGKSIDKVSFAASCQIITIGEYAFSGCSMTSITLPESLITIGDFAFSGCSSLTTLTIPKNVAELYPYYTLSYCSSLQEIIVDAGNTKFSSDGGVLYEGTTLWRYPSAKSGTKFTIPEGITDIQYGAFEECLNLQEITLPSTITDVSHYAFDETSALAAINVNVSAGEFSTGGFYSSDGILYKKNDDKVILYRYPQAKEGDSFTVQGPVSKIRECAFAGCQNLKSVYISDNIEMGSVVFQSDTVIEHVTLPKGLTQIPSQTFQECYSLKSITIPASVTSIEGTQVFQFCKSLTTINYRGSEEQKNQFLENIPGDDKLKDENIVWKCNYTGD